MCNTPTVIIFTENVKKYLDREENEILRILFSAKIVHYDQAAACDHIYAVWNDVQKWWMDAKTQNARQTYLDHDAHTPSWKSFGKCLKRIYRV